MVEDIEKGILRTNLTRELLNIVDDKHIDSLVEVDKIGNLAILVRRLELSLEFIHRDVKNLQLWMTLTHLVTNSLHDMCFTQTRITINI